MVQANKFFIIIFILCIAAVNLLAQNQVDVKLKQPPPNQMGIGDMWNLELNNTTGKDMKIYLTGTATEEKDGLIIEGKSKVFTIKPGRSNYKYNDFSGAEVKYNNGKYKEIILRTGNAPEGNYTICVTAFDESGTEVGRENCIMQSVVQMGSITLLTPGDGEEIDPKMPIIFTWTPLPKGGPYSLRIVEIKGDQSPDVAIKQNRAIFEKDGIKVTSYQYNTTDPKLETGKKYAWIVLIGEIRSDILMFSPLPGGGSINVIMNPRPCPGVGCCFDLSIDIVGNMNNYKSFEFRSIFGGITSVSAAQDITILSQTTSNVVFKKNTGVFNNGTSIGTICFQQTNNPIPISIRWSSNGGSFLDPPDKDTLHCPPPCPPQSICDCNPVSAVGYDYYPNGSFDPNSAQHLSTTCGSVINVAQGSRINPTTGFSCAGNGCFASVTYDLFNVTQNVNVLQGVNVGNIFEYQFNTCDSFRLTMNQVCMQSNGTIVTECPQICVIGIKVGCISLTMTQLQGGCCFDINVTAEIGYCYYAWINSPTNPIISTNPVNSLSYPITPPAVNEVTWSGNNGNPFPIGTNFIGTICFQNTGTFPVTVNWSTDGGTIFSTQTFDLSCPSSGCDCNPVSAVGYDYYPDGSFNPNSAQHLSTTCGSVINVAQGSRINPTTGFSCAGNDCFASVTYDLYNVTQNVSVLQGVNVGNIFEYQFNTCDSFRLTMNQVCMQSNGTIVTDCPQACVIAIKVNCSGSSCECNPVSAVGYDYYPNGSFDPNSAQHLTTTCGSVINVAQGSRINPTTGFSCSGDGCFPSVTYDLFNVTQNVSVLQGVNAGNIFEYQFNTCDSFRLTMNQVCMQSNGTVVTDCPQACVIAIKVNCTGSSCECNPVSAVGYDYYPNGSFDPNSAQHLSTTCGSVINVTQGSRINPTTGFSCAGNDCFASVTYDLFNVTQNVSVLQGVNAGNVFEYQFNACDSFRLTMNQVCMQSNGTVVTDCPQLCVIAIKVNCAIGNPCDLFNASVSPAQGPGNCCWNLHLQHPPVSTEITAIRLIPLSPSSFITSSVVENSPDVFINTINSGLIELLPDYPNTTMPTGDLPYLLDYCLNFPSSEQKVVVQWMKGQNNDLIVCSDTIITHCEVPCVAIDSVNVECSGNSFDVRYAFHNNSHFDIDRLIYSVITPPTAVINPAVFDLTPNVSQNGTGIGSFNISGVEPNSQVCILVKYAGPDTCCWCFDTLCITIPECICGSVDAQLINGNPYNCCYDLVINNTHANYFTNLVLESLSPGVFFRNKAMHTGWIGQVTGSNPTSINVFKTPQWTTPIPAGTNMNILNFCLGGYTSTPQTLVLKWMNSQEVVCTDTLYTECIPPPPQDTCAVIFNDTLICNEDNTFTYNFQVANFSTQTAMGLDLAEITPAGFLISPSTFNVNILPGGVSPMLSATISGVPGNTSICFKVGIYDHPEAFSECCYSDDYCITTPDCGEPLLLGCCDFIADSAKTLSIGVNPAGSIVFTNYFVVPPPAVTITKVKVQILEISVNNTAVTNANIFDLQKTLPAPIVTGDVSTAINARGNAVWFKNPGFPVTGNSSFSGTLSFTGTINNVNAANVNQVKLKLRYTFYKDDGVICERDILFQSP